MNEKAKSIPEAFEKCYASNKIYIVKNKNTIIRYTTIGKKKNKYFLYIRIKPQKSYNKNTSLFEAIGFCDEYKRLFDTLKQSTQLSKKEISNILKSELTLSENSNSLFKTNIPKNKIN